MVRTIGEGYNRSAAEALINEAIGVSEFGELDDRMKQQLNKSCGK
jgi:hypothetical protein